MISCNSVTSPIFVNIVNPLSVFPVLISSKNCSKHQCDVYAYFYENWVTTVSVSAMKVGREHSGLEKLSTTDT
jgi:hypothetical protein